MKTKKTGMYAKRKPSKVRPRKESRPKRNYSPKKKKTYSENTEKFVKFSITFIICSLILSILVGFYIYYDTQNKNDKNKKKDTNGIKSSLNVAVFGLNDKQELKNIGVLQFDSGKNKVEITGVSANTVVDTEKQKTLADQYVYGGPQYCRDALAAATKLQIDRYIIVDFKSAKSLVDAFGGLEYSADQDLNYAADDNAYYVRIEKGKHILSGEQVVNLMRSPVFATSQKELADNTALMLSNAVNMYLTEYNMKSSQKLFNQCIGIMTKSDITASDFFKYEQLMRYFAGINNGDICEVKSLKGDYRSDLFYPEQK